MAEQKQKNTPATKHEQLPTIVSAQLLPPDGGLLHLRVRWPGGKKAGSGSLGEGEPTDPTVRRELVREALEAAGWRLAIVAESDPLVGAADDEESDGRPYVERYVRVGWLPPSSPVP